MSNIRFLLHLFSPCVRKGPFYSLVSLSCPSFKIHSVLIVQFPEARTDNGLQTLSHVSIFHMFAVVLSKL